MPTHIPKARSWKLVVQLVQRRKLIMATFCLLFLWWSGNLVHLNARLSRQHQWGKGGFYGDICLFALVPYHNGTWTRAFSDDFWQWNQQVTLTSFAEQTYTDFTLLTASPPDGLMFDSGQVKVVLMTEQGHLQVEQIVEDRGTCSWVVSTRCDGDDYVLPTLMENIVAELEEQVTTSPDIEMVVMAQHNATVVSVDGNGSLYCGLHTYWLGGDGISLGQTLAIRYDVWKRSGGLLVTECDHTRVIEYAKERLSINTSYAFRIFPEQLGLVMYTRLSGHFPWNVGLPLCNKTSVEAQLGFPILAWLQKKPVPATSLQDVCTSNRYFRLVRANNFLFNYKNETCAQMSARYGHALLPRNQTLLKGKWKKKKKQQNRNKKQGIRRFQNLTKTTTNNTQTKTKPDTKPPEQAKPMSGAVSGSVQSGQRGNNKNTAQKGDGNDEDDEAVILEDEMDARDASDDDGWEDPDSELGAINNMPAFRSSSRPLAIPPKDEDPDSELSAINNAPSRYQAGRPSSASSGKAVVTKGLEAALMKQRRARARQRQTGALAKGRNPEG